MSPEAFSLAAALSVGFVHAFEADHLVAVSALVTQRNSTRKSLKDGIFWGLGHTSTILLIGLVMIMGKRVIAASTFSSLEAGVGFMLIGLGLWRLWKVYQKRDATDHGHFHQDETTNHSLAYGVGAVHGLAGSGALLLIVLANMQNATHGLGFLVLFGVGSVVGMLVASGLFSVPFSKKITANATLHIALTVVSAVLCIYFGGLIVQENLGI